MPFYRKKPHTILAFHFISMEESLEDLVEFVGISDMMYVNNNLIIIKSPSGDCKLIDGDYLVRDNGLSSICTYSIDRIKNLFDSVYWPSVIKLIAINNFL